jgi:hypothetical protein
MKRTPIPRENNSHPPVVRATVVESHTPPRPQFTFDDTDDPDAGNDDAPWSDVPLSPARKYIRDNPDAAIAIIFPTVYDEDRSKKLEDLAIAETAGTIAHQRMAEQMAKELGFDNYNYESEMQAIELERQTLPPFITKDVPETTGLPGSRPATGLGDMPAMPNVAVRRTDVSGEQKATFRRQQRAKAMERQLRQLQAQVRTLLRQVAEAKPLVVNVTVEPPKAKHVVIERDARGLAKSMREVSEVEPPPDQ